VQEPAYFRIIAAQHTAVFHHIFDPIKGVHGSSNSLAFGLGGKNKHILIVAFDEGYPPWGCCRGGFSGCGCGDSSASESDTMVRTRAHRCWTCCGPELTVAIITTIIIVSFPGSDEDKTLALRL
jgi:hypothetical protein